MSYLLNLMVGLLFAFQISSPVARNYQAKWATPALILPKIKE